MPGGQLVQDELPVASAYVPAGHCAQGRLAPVAALKKPAAQATQAVADCAPELGDTVPGGHGVHCELPVEAA